MPIIGTKVERLTTSGEHELKKSNQEETCLECNKPAKWIRSTQFAGDHPYCEEHAREEKDFQENDSYAYWYRIEDKA